MKQKYRQSTLWKQRLCVVVAVCAVAPFAFAGDFQVEFEGTESVRFEADGDIVLTDGWVVEHARLHEWTSELNMRDESTTPAVDNVKEFVVRVGANIVALIDARRGNLYLRGQATQVTNLTASSEQELIIESGGTAYAIIDENGNLDYRGAITEATAGATLTALEAQYDTYNYDSFDHVDYVDSDETGWNFYYKFVGENMYLNPGNFTWAELACNHAPAHNAHDDWQWDETVSKMFQAVRNEHGGAIGVTSGFRCPVHNNSVPSGTGSKHAYGRAFDFQQSGSDYEELSLANWDVAQDAVAAGVDSDRVFLYPYAGGTERSYQWFDDNNYSPDNFPNNLPPGWNRINQGHCDSGQPTTPNREDR